jgi:hypothetical protein
MYYYINPAIEFISFLIALFYLATKKIGWYKNFIWFLFLVVTTEAVGNTAYFYWHQNNHWIYNAYLPVEILFKSWILYKICQPHFNSRPVIISGLVVFSISYLAESITAHFLKYSSNTNVLFSVWVILVCFYYYYCLIKGENNITIYRHPPFWIITGLFFFYFISTASNLFFDYLIQINKKELVPIRYTIFLILDLILYSSWSYAFICRYKQTISS